MPADNQYKSKYYAMVPQDRAEKNPRKVQILQEVANGLTNKQIAAKYNLALQSVKNIRRRTNGAHAVAMAMRDGVIE